MTCSPTANLKMTFQLPDCCHCMRNWGKTVKLRDESVVGLTESRYEFRNGFYPKFMVFQKIFFLDFETPFAFAPSWL